MAEREEEVIRALVQKICSSDGGCCLSEVVSDISRLCQLGHTQENDRSTNTANSRAADPQSSVANIWKRLTEEPEISVGFERQFNGLTLPDLRAQDCLPRVYYGGLRDLQGQSQPVIATTVEQISSTFCVPSPELQKRQTGGGHSQMKQSSSSIYSAEVDTFDDPSPPTRQASRRRARSSSIATLNFNKANPRTATAKAKPKAVKEGPPRRRQEPNDPRKVGGSRKYLRGTEGFWNEHFWQARNQCEGVITPRHNAGIATHPAARALFVNRPVGIDEAVLRAIQTGLPVPAEPQNITSAWMNRTLWLLNRSQHGVYVSPPGVRRVDHSQYANHSEEPLSQILIVKSDRLAEIEFSEQERHSGALYFTTSAAHTTRRQGFFSNHSTSSTGAFGPQPPEENTEKNLAFMISPAPRIGLVRQRGPHLGVFYHHETPSTDNTPPPEATRESPITPNRGDRRSRDSMAMETTSPTDLMSRETTVSLESLPTHEGQLSVQETASWQVLPPALTTRSRKRKFSDHVQAAKPSSKSQKQNTVADTDVTNSLLSLPSLPATTEITIPRASDAVNVDEDPSGVIAPTPSPPKENQSRRRKTPTNKKPRENVQEIIKQVLLEVLEDCGGMIPYEFLSFSDYLNEKWRTAGRSGQLDKKRLMDVVKSLCTSGKLKKLAFTFQRKSGTMATKALLTNVDVDATSDAVKRLQQNIINALPDLYVPPLGSVLDAPSIEAPTPESPPKKPQVEKKAFGDNQRSRNPIHRRSRTKCGARKDVLGAYPARRPFTRQGALNLKPMQGSEDAFALAFVYLAASQRETGSSRWNTADLRRTRDDHTSTKRKVAVPKSRLSTRTRARSIPALSSDSANPRSRREGLNWRTEKPIRSLIRDTEFHEEPPLDESLLTGTPKFGRSSRGRKIIWKNRDSDVLPPSLPSSLQGILDMPDQIPAIDYSMTEDPDMNFFYWQLDAVEYWEGNILKIYQQQASEWTFINHTSKERNLPGLEQSTDWQWKQPEILNIATYTPRSLQIKPNKAAPKTKPPKRPRVPVEHAEDESIDSDYDPTVENNAEAPIRKRQRRSSGQTIQRPNESSRRKHTRRQIREARENGEPLTRASRPRILKTMSTAEVYRIVVSVVVVRTLSGGISNKIDWSIVQRLCPDRNEAFLQERWQTLITKNRRDINNLSASMQEKYITAYEKGEVPGINFDDIHNNNWETILLWAEKHLDKTNSSVDDSTLPSTRAQLLRTKNYTFDEPQTMREPLAYTGSQVRALKEQILGSTPTAIPLQNTHNDGIGLRVQAEAEEEDHNLSLAKSWAVSTVLTPESTLDATAVTKKLSKITPNKKEAEDLFEKALKVLQRNLVIKRNNKGAGISQGGWRPSDRWFEMFETKRMITASMLKKAAGWKRDVLDVAFARGEGVEIQKTRIMQDGEMVAIVNLVANGRCKITAGPGGLPRGRYGLDPEATTYNTKGMSRLLTLFATTVRPLQDRYVPGDPMDANRLAIPPWQDDGRGKIPCWIDMNGNLLKDIWEMVISATVGLLSGRPGLQVVEIERSLGHGLAGWEVQTVISWLSDSGFIQRTSHGTGWETKEWWWMVCGYAS